MIGEFSILTLVGLTLGLLLTGAIAGVLAGLLGVGGGIVIVPVLIVVTEIFGIDDNIAMLLVVGTSLATIIPTSLSSARAHHKRGAIDKQIVRDWAPAVFIGALVGGVASKYVGSHGLTLVFGVVALLVSINLFMGKTITLADKPPESRTTQSAIALPIGFISSLMGIGGGTLSVPVLSMLSVTVHRAVATASVFGLLIAVPALFGFIWAGWGVDGRPPGSFGYVNVPAAVVLFSMSVFTAPYGAKLAHSMEPGKLKLAFAVFLGISALRMLWKSLT